MSEQCTAITAKGTRCKAWAVRASQPPTCAAHRQGPPQVGAPPGNRNALKHGAYQTTQPAPSLDQVIHGLHRRLEELSTYIDNNRSDLEPAQYLAAVRLQGMLANRIGRLHRDRAELHGDVDDLDEAIDAALDVVGGLLGVDL